AHGDAADRQRLERNRACLVFLGRLESVAWLADAAPEPQAAIALVGGMKILIPLADLIDKAAELARLDRELERLGRDLARSEAKLGNADFLGRAPAAVVDKERTRLADIQLAMTRLEEQRERIGRL
nr:valine--tRNA ligase [Pseudomonadota bacterium]